MSPIEAPSLKDSNLPCSLFQCNVIKIESALPIVVDAVNDPPEVVTPHHQAVKLGAFGVWSRYLTTQTGIRAAEGNITMRILTETTSGRLVLHGVDTKNVTVQVRVSAGTGENHSLKA